MNRTRHKQDFETIMLSLWKSWCFSTGAIFLPVLLSLWIPCSWIPVLSLVLMLLIMALSRTQFAREVCRCYLISSIATRTLFISAIIMEAIYIATSTGFLHKYFDSDTINDSYPFLTVMVVSPVMLAVSMFYNIRGSRSGICRRCTVQFGTVVERGFIGAILNEESKYQLMISWVMPLVSLVVSTAYYFIFYINVNINSADAFFLNWLPFIWYILTALFLGVRYATLWGYYCRDVEGGSHRQGEKTWMRYIIICENDIFLSRLTEFYDRPGMDKIDTPASLNVSYREHPTLDYARQVFSDISDIKEADYDMRFMYVSAEAGGMSNIYHYIITLPDKKVTDGSQLRGKWYSISQLQRLIYNRDLSPIMASEINRLYTVAQAWKTYDRDGNRLYKVKNYRPMFRFSGIGEWEVDFNDPHWLKVAQFNQDKPFFKFRRWLRRMAGDY